MDGTSLRCPPDRGEPDECAYIIGAAHAGGDSGRRCARPRQPGSSYCPQHHALCHLPSGSAAETRRLQGLETLAIAVGGRCGSADAAPSPGFLGRVERLSRQFL